MPRASVSRSRGCSENGERTLRLPAGTILFDSARPSRRMQRLNAGRVRLLAQTKTAVEYLEPGDFFGETCLLRSRCGDQIAQTLTPVEIAIFQRSELLNRIQHDRLFASALLRNLARRIQRYQTAVTEFVTEPAERRLALLLIRLAPRRRASDWVRLPFTLTNLELARTIGTTRGRISYFLNRFERQGCLIRHEGLNINVVRCEEFLKSTAGST